MPARGPISVLIRALGARGAARVAFDVAWRSVTDPPFATLPPPLGPRETRSRRQAAPAVLLYRSLLERLPRAAALALASDVIVAGAASFLRRTMADVRPTDIVGMNPAQRARTVTGWLDRVFTQTYRLGDVADDRLSWTVTACALARLARVAGHPELASAFCKADGAFFHGMRPTVRMERPSTIAEGADTCVFRLDVGGGPG